MAFIQVEEMTAACPQGVADDNSNRANYHWFKSERSTATCTCVEVCFAADQVLIRDSKQLEAAPERAEHFDVIALSTGQWSRFLDEVTGRSAPDDLSSLTIAKSPDGYTMLWCRATGTNLAFTHEEWVAFVAGALGGEFNLPSSAEEKVSAGS